MFFKKAYKLYKTEPLVIVAMLRYPTKTKTKQKQRNIALFIDYSPQVSFIQLLASDIEHC